MGEAIFKGSLMAPLEGEKKENRRKEEEEEEEEEEKEEVEKRTFCSNHQSYSSIYWIWSRVRQTRLDCGSFVWKGQDVSGKTTRSTTLDQCYKCTIFYWIFSVNPIVLRVHTGFYPKCNWWETNQVFENPSRLQINVRNHWFFHLVFTGISM